MLVHWVSTGQKLCFEKGEEKGSFISADRIQKGMRGSLVSMGLNCLYNVRRWQIKKTFLWAGKGEND